MQPVKLVQMARFTLALFAIALTSCATSIPKGEKFSSASPDALIVFATSSEVGAIVSFVFSTYDPETRRTTGTSFKGQYLLEHYAGLHVRYNVLRVPAGHYVFKSVSDGMQTVFLKQGTVAFRVEPGQIAYLGAYRYDGRTADRTEGDIELARARVAEYPDVTGEVELIVLKETTYE